MLLNRNAINLQQLAQLRCFDGYRRSRQMLIRFGGCSLWRHSVFGLYERQGRVYTGIVPDNPAALLAVTGKSRSTPFVKKLLFIPLFAAACGQAFATEPAFTLKNNDTWVMAGDSITAQRLHTNFIEAFFRTRYPQWHLHFRNSGQGGNRVGDVSGRFDYDVAAWKPTIVSVELGMNDTYGANPDSKDAPSMYINDMKLLVAHIRSISAQPLVISSSPINDGSTMGNWKGVQGHALDPFTDALKDLGQKENFPVVDQFHPLLSLWAANQADKVNGISFGGDAVHVNAIAQYTMAATILKALDVDRDVSSATINPDGQVVASTGCKISDVASSGGKLSFTRLDERSPWPLLPDGFTAAKLLPDIFDLSRYTLTIPNLPAGQYRVTMDDKPVATLSNEVLANGWNISTVSEGPLADRAVAIMGLINQLQSPLNQAWRSASQAKDTVKRAAAQKDIDDTEAKLQSACQPTPIRFVIELVK